MSSIPPSSQLYGVSAQNAVNNGGVITFTLNTPSGAASIIVPVTAKLTYVGENGPVSASATDETGYLNAVPPIYKYNVTVEGFNAGGGIYQASEVTVYANGI
jgi:hypothetical protein